MTHWVNFLGWMSAWFSFHVITALDWSRRNNRYLIEIVLSLYAFIGFILGSFFTLGYRLWTTERYGEPQMMIVEFGWLIWFIIPLVPVLYFFHDFRILLGEVFISLGRLLL